MLTEVAPYILFVQSGIPDPPGMSKAMVEQKQKERKFLEQLLHGKKVENYTIPVPIKAELDCSQQKVHSNVTLIYMDIL